MKCRKSRLIGSSGIVMGLLLFLPIQSSELAQKDGELTIRNKAMEENTVVSLASYGDFYAMASQGSTKVQVFQHENPEETKEFDAEIFAPRIVALSQKYLACAGESNVKIFDRKSKECKSNLFGGNIKALLFADDTTLVIGSQNGGIWAWNFKDGRKEKYCIVEIGDPFEALATHEKKLAYATLHNVYWDVPLLSEQDCDMAYQHKPIIGKKVLAYSPDGTKLAVWNSSYIYILNTQDEKKNSQDKLLIKMIEFPSNDLSYMYLAFFDDNRIITCYEREVKLWNINTGKYEETHNLLYPIMAATLLDNNGKKVLQCITKNSQSETSKKQDNKSEEPTNFSAAPLPVSSEQNFPVNTFSAGNSLKPWYYKPLVLGCGVAALCVAGYALWSYLKK